MLWMDVCYCSVFIVNLVTGYTVNYMSDMFKNGFVWLKNQLIWLSEIQPPHIILLSGRKNFTKIRSVGHTVDQGSLVLVVKAGAINLLHFYAEVRGYSLT